MQCNAMHNPVTLYILNHFLCEMENCKILQTCFSFSKLICGTTSSPMYALYTYTMTLGQVNVCAFGYTALQFHRQKSCQSSKQPKQSCCCLKMQILVSE